jgi:hypothetical protein
MSCLGVHFALTDAQLDQLLSAREDQEVREIIREMEQAWDEEHLQESGKAWDAMHRCLTDGTLNPEGGAYPLNHCVLGGRHLHQGSNYLAALVMPDEAGDVARGLARIDKGWFRQKYYNLPRPKGIGSYWRGWWYGDFGYEGSFGEEDFEATWEYFELVRAFYERAAGEGRAVLFTADQ